MAHGRAKAMTSDPRYGRALRALALLRAAAGIGLLVAPQRLTRAWAHDAASAPGGQLAARSLGARELAIAVGLLRTFDNPGDRRPWLAAGAVGDLADVVGTVSSLRELPLAWGAVVTIGAGTAAFALQLAAAMTGP